ncbi:MAG TPA: hypothetical protein DCM40_46345, partial [Maribacter sp.]|nr:hypothetical protein [Maribacter sp.]
MSPTKIFINEQGQIYDDDVMQSINGDYHTSGFITRDEIIAQLVGINADTSDMSEAFVAAVDSFNYIIAVYGDTEELLPRLDILRRSYIDKSTATPMGLWYQTLNTTLMRINSLVSKGKLLRRELVTTPVVVDNRNIEEGSYTQVPEGTYDLERDYIYTGTGAILMSRIGHFDQSLQYNGMVQPSEFDNDYTLIENGFFFFDYEKAIRNASVISKVFDIDNVQNMFGDVIINKYFKLSKVGMQRIGRLPFEGDTKDIIFNKEANYVDTMDISYPQFDNMTYTIAQHTGQERANAVYQYGDTIIYPELILRNMHIPGNDSINQYRLMTFQFQDIMPSEGKYPNSNRDSDYLTFSVDCKDYTKQLVNEITSSYTSLLTGSFADYVNSAEEFCSYNDLDGYFNDFFVQAMEDAYADSTETAPWITMPILYNIQLDLINGIHEGSMQRIIDASIITSEQISPATGRIENLRAFQDNLQAIVDFYNGSTFSAVIEPYDDEEVVVFGGVELVDVQNYGLPDFLNLTEQLIWTGDDANIQAWNSHMANQLDLIKAVMINQIAAAPGISSSELDDFKQQIPAAAQDAMLTVDALKESYESGALFEALEADTGDGESFKQWCTGLLAAAGVSSGAAAATSMATTTYFMGTLWTTTSGAATVLSPASGLGAAQGIRYAGSQASVATTGWATSGIAGAIATALPFVVIAGFLATAVAMVINAKEEKKKYYGDSALYALY